MRFTNLLTASTMVAVAASGASASAVVSERASINLGLTLHVNNHYGAPTPPWETGCKPGWYYGHKGGLLTGLTSLTSGVCTSAHFIHK